MRPETRRAGLGVGCCALLVLLPSWAGAHHILGIPHYAYDEQYPQTPVLTYLVNAGANEVKMTGYPGVPQPGEQCTLHVYIRRRDSGHPFDGPVTLTVREDRLIQTDPVVYGPITARLEQAVYKFYPRFPSEANYLTRIEFDADGEPWQIDLPMVVGEPGSPWAVLAGVGVTTVVFLVVVRAVRIKMRRRVPAVSRGTTAGRHAGPSHGVVGS